MASTAQAAQPLHEFRCTINENWTAGKPNTEVPHERRTPGFYVRASSSTEAAEFMAAMFSGKSFTVTVHKSNVSPITFEGSK